MSSTFGRPCGITPAYCIAQMKEVAPPSLSSDHVPPHKASSQSPLCKVCAGIPDTHIELTVEILPLIKCLCMHSIVMALLVPAVNLHYSQRSQATIFRDLYKCLKLLPQRMYK